ncbi:7-carboxy-7-deazaguanine synthase QueE [Shewanella sp. Scap07]|uniref:7-carboxy-7-deazaguanine synthase QueE n=1 Tax=Shewanella sp. Scap07 TaxID=2589987 RepID=UPI0015BE14FC|nr:7-carboxy-7-deazaguanine synthase QueE [Shewanella sp. Scap07]QLE85659.1 7-carboxy-7-deazaguanine synthase QueE [Shewanella sp. Scap07]
MNYPVNEVFETIQGEGMFTGVPAIFVRLQGCPVGCAWCDTQHTWEKLAQNQVSPEQVIQVDGSIGRWSEMTAKELIGHFTRMGFSARHVVITGGEPCMYDLQDLTTALEQAGYRCQIETSGTFEVNCSVDTWVTVSPKINMKAGMIVRQDALQRANEIKHPVGLMRHVEELDALVADIDTTDKVMCLQPISQKARATELAMQVCIDRNWRLSIQTHKYLNID